MKKLFFVSLLCLMTSLAFSQGCNFKYGATEADSLKCLEEVSSFRIFFNNKQYADALTPWHYVVNNCPCAWDGIYTNAQTLFDNLIKNEKDSAKREALIDDLIESYRNRHLYFPKKYTEGNGLGFMAFNTTRYRMKSYLSSRNYEAIEEVYNWFVRSVEMEKENTQPGIWDSYFTVSEIMTQMKKDTTIIIDAYERATDYIDVAIVNAYVKYEKQLPNFINLDSAFKLGQINKMEYDKRFKQLSADTARQMKLVSNYRKTLSNIEGKFQPYAPCNVLEQVYAKKIDQNRNNIKALKKMVLTMSKGNCITSPVFKEALELVHAAEPGAQSAYLMGNLSLRNNEVDKAIEYFNEAISLFETQEQKVDCYYMLGLAYQLQQKYSEARSAALQAIKIHPNCGKAYILIGDLYATSGNRCGGDDFLPRCYNWAAADKYAKAAAVDPSCAETASEKRAKLAFPSKQDRFVRGLQDGQSFHVGCWIQETTTVR